jgi:hypothetical protein
MRDHFTRSENIERVYKSGWHAMIAGVGVYEYRVHKTWLSKILSVCLIAFHVDAAIADWQGTNTMPQRFIKKVLDMRARACYSGRVPLGGT